MKLLFQEQDTSYKFCIFDCKYYPDYYWHNSGFNKTQLYTQNGIAKLLKKLSPIKDN